MSPPVLEAAGASPPPLTAAEMAKYFPAKTRDVPPGTFELGLVLGGTVSAGAYTGGVLDFLIEALDAWQREKDAGNPDAPDHRVVITTVGGTSGGAINGAILLRSLGREFGHGDDPGNPFFTTWTKGVDIMKLLSLVGDTPGFASLLNTSAIEQTATAAVRWNGGSPLGSGASPARRSYLADPLRLFMMVGNVTGIPYSIPLLGQSGLSHDMVAHTDYMRFALTVAGGAAQEVAERPDELALGSDSPINWDDVATAALATSAFPLAFSGRLINRDLAASGYRAIAVPSDDKTKPAIIRQLRPRWQALPRNDSSSDISLFANVDGGTFNNEPLDVVRTAMSGFDSRNSRSSTEATRAVILIDPFSDPETLSVPDVGRLTSMIGPLISSLIQQPRFKPEDLALAGDENVYSRFLVAPVRYDANKSPIIGARAIAAGGLGGFLGFVDARLLVHDYLLGRMNAQAMLKRHLVFPDDGANTNKLFSGWTTAQKNKYRYTDSKGNRFLPLIPLMDSVPEPQSPAWPKPTSLPPGFATAVQSRLEAIYGRLKDQFITSALGRFGTSVTVDVAWNVYIRGAIRDAVVGAFTKALNDQDL